MGEFSVLNFVTVSLPEEFAIVFFIWILSGNRKEIPFGKVIIMSVLVAILFEAERRLFYPQTYITVLLQFVTLTLFVFFIFKQKFFVSLIQTLLTTVVVSLIQATSIGVILLFDDELFGTLVFNLLNALIEMLVLGMLTLFLFKKNITFFYSKENESIDVRKSRYVILQLTFAFIIIVINYTLFTGGEDVIHSKKDMVLFFVNCLSIIMFSLLIIFYAFRLGKSIQKVEEEKRIIENKEVVQNIDYLCHLIETKKYDEVNMILKSVKTDLAQKEKQIKPHLFKRIQKRIVG